MKISDFFKKNNKKTFDDELKNKNKELEELKYKINELEAQIEYLKNTSDYKTGKVLEGIQYKLNNNDTNSFNYSCDNIQIKNNKVYIDGVEQTDITNCKNKNIFIKLNNECDIEATNVDNLVINGNVNDVDITNGDIKCNNIEGDIDITNGNIYRN